MFAQCPKKMTAQVEPVHQVVKMEAIATQLCVAAVVVQMTEIMVQHKHIKLSFGYSAHIKHYGQDLLSHKL